MMILFSGGRTNQNSSFVLLHRLDDYHYHCNTTTTSTLSSCHLLRTITFGPMPPPCCAMVKSRIIIQKREACRNRVIGTIGAVSTLQEQWTDQRRKILEEPGVP